MGAGCAQSHAWWFRDLTLPAAGRISAQGSVKFLFQPAEEGLGGAREMIKDGCLDGVDAVYGCHLWTYDEVGVVGVQSGPVMAASDRFEITVRGAGGHGAAPQGTVDAVVAASQLVVALQSVVARNVNPLENAVVTVGQINGGYNYNIIADEVRLVGTVRSFSSDVQAKVVRRINEIAQHTAAAFGGEGADAARRCGRGPPRSHRPPPPRASPLQHTWTTSTGTRPPPTSRSAVWSTWPRRAGAWCRRHWCDLPT